MDENSTQKSCFSPVLLRIGLLFVLVATITIVVSSISWIYYHVHQSLGPEIAEVVVAVMMIIILALIVVGFRAGFGAREVLMQRKRRARRIYRLFKRSYMFRALWGHVGLPSETQPNIAAIRAPVVMDVVLDPTPKRGRHATFPIERWIKVVAAWENRDRWRNTLTLSEFLAEQFGTNADGSPLMSANTFYDWKKRVHEELEKRAANNVSPN
jgi:type II secretory pathway pseudopilin PulG